MIPGVRRLVSLLLLATLLAVASQALPCVADEGCCPGDSRERPMDPDCACCVHLARVEIPDATAAPVPAHAAGALSPRASTLPASPDPREILHVPRAGASSR